MENQSHHGQAYQTHQSFWKKNTRAVPGRPSPKQDIKLGKLSSTTPMSGSSSANTISASGGAVSGSSGGSTSFQDFQESVDDAWDSGDDEFCTVSDVKISKRVSHSAAISVINSHRSRKTCIDSEINLKSSQRVQEIIPEEKRAEALQRLAVQPLHLRNVNLSMHSQMNNSQHSMEDTDVKYGASPQHKPTQFPGRPQPLRQTNAPTKFFIPSKEQDGESKVDKFQSLLEASVLNLDELRQLSWSGIPARLRSVTWRLLSEYLPANLERRQHVLERKRLDYWNLVKQYYDTERDEGFQDTYRQIHIDIPRMSPLISLFQQTTVQLIFERILYIWAIRHPASGYVQGMNDLVTPFFLVFLQEAVPVSAWQDLENYDVATLQKEQRDIIEADSFWCLSKFLDGIQDNYIFAQLGIQHKVNQLKELIQRIDAPLHQHLHQHGVDYLQFSFRWMNNLLTREIPLHCTIRLWDTYLAESDRFASFQLYVCAAFLLRWRRHLLLQPDFQGLMLMLQNLPTQNWTDSEIGILVAEAYKLKFTFADAPNHLQAHDTRFCFRSRGHDPPYSDKPDHYQEWTEIMAGLENLNSKIREIWGVLNKRQDTNIPPPPTLMYSYLQWLRSHHLAAESNNIQGTFGTLNIQSNILSHLSTQPSTPVTQNIITQYGPNSGFTTSVCTVKKNSSNLMERTCNLRDWLRQVCVESTDQSRSNDSIKNNPQSIEKFGSKRHSLGDSSTRFVDVDSMNLYVYLSERFKKTCFR